MQQVFSQWNNSASSSSSSRSGRSAAAHARNPTGPSVNVQGAVCAVQPGSGRLRLLPDQDQDDEATAPILEAALDDSPISPLIHISVPRHLLDHVQPLDRVRVERVHQIESRNGSLFLEAHGVTIVSRMDEWLTPDVMAAQHVQFPDGEETLGQPFVIYSGLSQYEAVPGLHHAPAILETRNGLTFVNKKSGQETRRLNYSVVQRQWSTRAEFDRGPEPMTLQVTLWDDACRTLPGDGLTRDLTRWTAIMQAHPDIRFHALVAVDMSYQFGMNVNLKALGVRWDLRPYLEQRGIAIPDDTMKRLVPKSLRLDATNRGCDLINVSTKQARPAGPEWSFYALTADPVHISSVAALERQASTDALFFAVRRLVASPAPASPLPSSVSDGEEEEEEKEEEKEKKPGAKKRRK